MKRLLHRAAHTVGRLLAYLCAIYVGRMLADAYAEAQAERRLREKYRHVVKVGPLGLRTDEYHER